MDKLRNISRNKIQGLVALLYNLHIPNFFKGNIYNGSTKKVCLPGLNCYSCPGAAGSCPIGSMQAVMGSKKYRFSYYVFGMMAFFGVMVARLICGFLCPMGLFQDLLNKIPTKKVSTKKLKPLRLIKYIILFSLILALGLVMRDRYEVIPPYFCKYICPQGIIQGAIPLAIKNPSLRLGLGKLFNLKLGILITTIMLSIIFYRPFCKWICPLGAFYSFFNKYSFYQMKVDENKCIDCGKCARVCKMDVDIRKNNAHLECIRCHECTKACPTKAISSSLLQRRENEKDKQILFTNSSRS
ncbi:MAG: 4Fe-4S binding protein [Anaerococcus sp.]|uniref:4Fe-4S binding protein n=1 Tax=Anaerococcus sp. TaxID=1872515 RepID=UPI0028FF3220|nr:4Fe-4S binding protein [Anaerococcus sp.]MDU2566326.1 4Fe-4S binding protein [Anaerococcus sp.]